MSLRMKLIYPAWPRLPEQTEFHLPPHGPVVFAAALPPDVEVTFVDEKRTPLDTSDVPDVVALSVMLTCQIPRAKQIAAEYRRRGVPVLAGGIAVMLHAEEMAQACDAVFLGEAEGHIGAVLDDLRRGELRRVYDEMGRLPPTESIGPARRDILDRSLYVHRGVRMLDLVHASRGCRFHCAPCAVAYLGGRVFRPRPVAKVIEEIRGIDNHRLFFVDNSLAQDREWEKELFTALIPLRKKFVSHPIEADDEVLDLAYRAGSWYVYQAILGISDTLRERIRRYHDHGIGVEGTIILGTDDQDRDGVLRLLEFVKELGLDMAEFTVLTPFPHTSYREQLEREGRILHDRWEEYTSGRVVFQPKHMTPTELQDLYHHAWEDFYGPSGREEKMGRLFHKVVKRERADGTYVNEAAARRRGDGGAAH
jgi:radical SAM superfamily enzyme YgiQ (UPF0313 family)